MCQYLEDQHNSVNQYFPKNHAWVKDPFKVQDGLIDFHVIEYEEVINTVQIPRYN